MALQLAVSLLCAFLVLRVVFRKCTRRLPLPPGPKGLPIFGNIFEYPSSHEWMAFRDVGFEYNSDIIHYNILGQPLIIVNTEEAASELFVKRASIYSDKPNLPMVNDMYVHLSGLVQSTPNPSSRVGFTWNFAFLPYDDRWKEHRKVFHKTLEGSNLVALQYPHITQASRNLLQHIRERPTRIVEDLRLYAGQVILRVAYGIEVLDGNDPYVVTAEKGMTALSVAARPGAYWVDSLPILRYVPSWMPGAGWKRWANEARKSVDAMRNAPLEFVKKSMADGTAKPSLASRLLVEMEEDPTHTEEYKDVVGNVLCTMYAGGSDTVVAALTTFVLAIVQNPAVMRKAHEEIDSVIGADRLPEFGDRDCLPYTVALLKETLRWEPVTPLAVPHQVTQDDEFRGYHIPKNATIIGNSWAILRDKSVYGEDADVFNPERFLTADGQLDAAVPHPYAVFGFGRRICAGQDMGEATLWMGIVSMLAAFDITKAMNEHGELIEPSGEYQPGVVHHPEPFKCSIAPRSPLTEALIGVPG